MTTLLEAPVRLAYHCDTEGQSDKSASLEFTGHDYPPIRGHMVPGSGARHSSIRNTPLWERPAAVVLVGVDPNVTITVKVRNMPVGKIRTKMSTTTAVPLTQLQHVIDLQDLSVTIYRHDLDEEARAITRGIYNNAIQIFRDHLRVRPFYPAAQSA